MAKTECLILNLVRRALHGVLLSLQCLILNRMNNLTVNEMRALLAFSKEALADENLSADFANNPRINCRWETISPILKEKKLGTEYVGGKWAFRGRERVEALKTHLEDLLADEERREKHERMSRLAVLASSLAAAVSALCALASFLSRFL